MICQTGSGVRVTPKSSSAIFAAAIAFTFATARAQDTRNVTEPTIPPVCATLRAQLSAPHGIDPADETRLDTERLQSEISGCAAGKAVELAVDGSKNAFLSGPLELRQGVTLLIDKGVTLYGSRNPDDYATRPGS